MIRWLIAEVRHFATSVGYVIRPYDMLADRRRWWFQPRQRCGWSYGICIDERGEHQ